MGAVGRRGHGTSKWKSEVLPKRQRGRLGTSLRWRWALNSNVGARWRGRGKSITQRAAALAFNHRLRVEDLRILVLQCSLVPDVADKRWKVCRLWCSPFSPQPPLQNHACELSGTSGAASGTATDDRPNPHTWTHSACSRGTHVPNTTSQHMQRGHTFSPSRMGKESALTNMVSVLRIGSPGVLECFGAFRLRAVAFARFRDLHPDRAGIFAPRLVTL